MKMSYSEAVEWIAHNDEPTDTSEESVLGYISTQFCADVYGRDAEQVAHAVVKVRKDRDVQEAHERRVTERRNTWDEGKYEPSNLEGGSPSWKG